MEAGHKDGRHKIHCMEEDLAETRNKSYETVENTRCYSRRQISEMEDKVYAKSDKAEYTRHAIRQQAAEIIDEDKEKLVELQKLASKNMADKMAYMEENTSEFRGVTCHKMADVEEKTAAMALEMRINPSTCK